MEVVHVYLDSVATRDVAYTEENSLHTAYHMLGMEQLVTHHCWVAWY